MQNLYSIGFGYHILDLRTTPEFSNGVFPTSLLYQFDFPIPDFIPDNSSILTFRLDNGLDFRTLRQHPETGIPYAENPNNPSWNYPKEYMTVFDEMNLVFGQGFFNTKFSTSDLITLWATFDVRFENAYERFSYLRDPSQLDSLFGTNANPRFSSWLGQPELTDDRSTANVSISLGFDLNLMQDTITERNGLKNSFWFRSNPKWTDLFNDGTQDFILIWDKLDLALTIFHIDMHGSRDTTWLTMVIDNNTIYRYIKGNKVPNYIQKGFIFGTQALNTSHVITNRTSITFYGPQINSYDCYPLVSFFIDLGFSFGQLLNTQQNVKVFDTVASIGMKAEFIIFNTASFYYEIGYILDNVLNEQQTSITRIGFSLGI